jgi:pilus assembly protein TadC
VTGAGPAAALVLLAAALLTGAPDAGPRLRALLAGPAPGTPHPAPAVRPAWLAGGGVAVAALGWAATGDVLVAAAVGAVCGAVLAARRLAGRGRSAAGAELASGWELLAVCLEAGLPVAAALGVAAGPVSGPEGAELRRVAGLLELGADPAQAWRAAEPLPALAAFARAAARSAGTGAALARAARGEAARIRASLVDAAEGRAQRAAVHITGPLGLCFLPAFLVLGVAPVVIGLAGQALARW